MFKRTIQIILGILILQIGLMSAFTQAQSYPNKPIKIVIGFSPGGGPDISARAIGQKMTEKWGQSVIVENRPGAGANIATQVVATAKPDGYTLLSDPMLLQFHPLFTASYPLIL